MKKQIPKLLIISRLIIGFIILLLSFFKIENFQIAIVVLLTIGLLTDIFDGIIARKLNISTENLRRWDSSVDQIFFICVVGAAYLMCPEFFKQNVVKLFILFGLEILTYLVSFLKFKKEIATHSFGAKLWTLFLFATLVQILLTCQSNTLFAICFWLGLLTRLEIIAITLILKKWTNDVPTFYHAIKLRNGKKINRNKMFNG